jgi:hypothetical protein
MLFNTPVPLLSLSLSSVEAEAIYIKADSVMHRHSLVMGNWSSPTALGGQYDLIAIARG